MPMPMHKRMNNNHEQKHTTAIKRKATMMPSTIPFILTLAACVTRDVRASFVAPTRQACFVIPRAYSSQTATAKIQQSAATLDDPPKTPPPKKKKAKETPEAIELARVFQEREENTSPYKYIIAQTAPSVRVAFSEAFGKEPGAFKADLLVSSLKELGFDLVLDTNMAADLTICEEGNELLERILARERAKETDESAVESLPLFTSCCPGWMQLVKKSAPDLFPYISTCKSPHMSK